jgi:hypothetical protein
MDEFGRDLAEEAGEMVSGPVASATAELRKRRSTRIVQAVPLLVTGVDALGRTFTERTSTLIINCHGCRYQSKHYVLKNMWVTVEVPHSETGQPARTVRGRVAWIQRPRTVRQLFQVALELEVPGNIWGVGFPPEDWFSFPDVESAKAAAAAVGSAGPSQILAEPHSDPHTEPQPHTSAPETDFRLRLEHPENADLAAGDNLRVFPAPESVTDASLQMARQMGRLMADARQHIHAAAREAAAQAVSAERRISGEQWEQKLAGAHEELSRRLSDAIAVIQQESVNRSRAAQNAAIEALQSDLPRWLAPQLEELTRDLSAHLSQQALEQRRSQAEQFAQAMDALRSACQRAEEITAHLDGRGSQTEAHIAARSESAIRAAEESARQLQENLAVQLESLSSRVEEVAETANSLLSSAQASLQTYLNGELDAGQARLQIAIDNAVSGAHSEAMNTLQEHANALFNQFQEEAQKAAAASRDSVTSSANEGQQRLAALRDSARIEAERVELGLARAAEVSARLENFAERVGAAEQQSLGNFQAHVDDVLSLHRNELHRRCESLFEDINARIHAAFDESTRQSLAQFAQQIESLVQPHVSHAEEAVQRLAGGRSLLDAATTLQQERIRKAADEAFSEALAQFRGNLGSAEQLLRESADAVVARTLADLEGRAESAKHQVVEDLLRSAEWYEKKAQTQIQHLSEKAAEQAGVQLRQKAAEISNAFAGELDQASRSFVQHAQTQMEHVVRDSFAGARSLFSEAAETTSAAFIDEIQRQARQELGGFEAEVQKAASDSRSQLNAAHAELTQKVTAEQESFLLRFREAMQGALESGISEANQRVQTGFRPLLDAWKSVTDAHQEEMRRLYAKAGEQAAEQYRTRLENVSNQWMLATVASLDQQSRQVVSGIATTAEQKLRETCTHVFADIGDSLRERLRQIAANFSIPTPPAAH